MCRFSIVHFLCFSSNIRFFSMAASVFVAGVAQAAEPHDRGMVYTPDSSIEKVEDVGQRAHTHLHILSFRAGLGKPSEAVAKPAAAPFPGYYYETPASLGCVYRIVSTVVPGCNPNQVSANPSGGASAIAIIDAYDTPTAAQDLAIFSRQFGLPPANFVTVYANGVKPPMDSTYGWEIETALDIEWAHAMAPNAKIVLVEAASNSFRDLFKAVGVASNLLKPYAGEVSMSWGSSEFAGEGYYDQYLTTPNVVYVASAGDSAGVSYPSSSPYVVSAGGTTLHRDSGTGAFLYESAWQSTGGGASAYEARPSYQTGVSTTVGSMRGTPDIAFDADPASGVWVYSSVTGTPSWYVVGGTSLAAPALAGIINAASAVRKQFSASSGAELGIAYGNLGQSADFTDVISGYCGPYNGYSSGAGWDFCTGIGSVVTLTGK